MRWFHKTEGAAKILAALSAMERNGFETHAVFISRREGKYEKIPGNLVVTV